MSKQNVQSQLIIRAIRNEFPNSETLFDKAFEIMRLKANDRCVCGALISKYYKRLPTRQYKCMCNMCRLVVSIFSATPLRKSHKDMVQTLELAGHFYQKRKMIEPMQIVKWYNCRYKTAQTYTRRIIEWIKLAEESPGSPTKDENHLCRTFSSKYNNIGEVIHVLMNSLPPLTDAMKHSKTENKINHKTKML